MPTDAPLASRTFRHENDPEVKLVVSQAADAACEKLDTVFPGQDASGITSNFRGLLEQIILSMLTGESLPRPVHRTELPALVLTDASFGDAATSRGDLFLVCHRGARTNRPGALVLATAAVFPLERVTGEELFTSFAAAVQGAMKFLRDAGGAHPLVYPHGPQGDSEPAELTVRAVEWLPGDNAGVGVQLRVR